MTDDAETEELTITPAQAHADAAVALKLVTGGIISQVDAAACSPAFLAALMSRPGWQLREQAAALVDGLAEAILEQANPHCCNAVSSSLTTCFLLPEHDGEHHGAQMHITGSGFVTPWSRYWTPALPERMPGRGAQRIHAAVAHAVAARAEAPLHVLPVARLITRLATDVEALGTVAMAALGDAGYVDDHTVTFSPPAPLAKKKRARRAKRSTP